MKGINKIDFNQATMESIVEYYINHRMLSGFANNAKVDWVTEIENDGGEMVFRVNVKWPK